MNESFWYKGRLDSNSGPSFDTGRVIYAPQMLDGFDGIFITYIILHSLIIFLFEYIANWIENALKKKTLNSSSDFYDNQYSCSDSVLWNIFQMKAHSEALLGYIVFTHSHT